MKNKTLLIYVQDYVTDDSLSSHSQEELNIPLGILYLGSYLYSHGYKIRLFDTRLKNKDEFFKTLQAELNDTILVGLSVTTPCIGYALGISKFIKKIDPLIKIVWGGIHATLFPESTIHNEYIDFIIVKEGEKGLLGLVKYLLGEIIKISEVPNLVFIENDAVVENKFEIEEDLKAIGIPNYGLLDMDRYVDRIIHPGYRRRQAEIITSRGCPHKCTFCVNVIVNQSRQRAEPLEQTLENLDYLIEQYKVEHIFFMDEDLFCNHNRIRSFVDEITKRDVTWESNCRADYISDDYIDDDFLEYLRESGCVKLRFGLESGSQRILDLLKKEITVEQSISAVERLTQHKILPSVSFMMGIPGETINDVAKTTDLILKLFTINLSIDIIGPLIFRPYPGSKLFEKCREKGLVIPESLDEWSGFYIHNLLEEYQNGLPWFPFIHIFKRVGLCLGYLRLNLKFSLLRWLIPYLVKFHIITKWKFIYIDYSIYRFIKRAARMVRRKLHL